MLYEFKIKARSGPSRARPPGGTSPMPPIDWVGSCLGRAAALAPTPTPMNGRHLHWPKDGGPRSGPCRSARHCGHRGLGLSHGAAGTKSVHAGTELPLDAAMTGRVAGASCLEARGSRTRHVCSCRGGLRRTSPTACPSFTPPALPACLTGALPEDPPRRPRASRPLRHRLARGPQGSGGANRPSSCPS